MIIQTDHFTIENRNHTKDNEPVKPAQIDSLPLSNKKGRITVRIL